MRALLIAIACAACYEPPDQPCSITCTTECPSGLTCTNGVCVRDGETCDGNTVGFVQVSVGGRHVCGLDDQGTAYCWGDNRFSQLGTSPSELQVARPVAVSGRWSAITTGGLHTCGLADGVAYCWGDNSYGQALGARGGKVPVPQEIQFGLATPPRFTKIAAGGTVTCALGSNQVYCWGEKELVGVDAPPEVAVKLAGDDWTDIALGPTFGCGVTSSGIKCWGSNIDGIAGLPATTLEPLPKIVSGFPGGTVSSLEAGFKAACAVIDGGLWCWGDAMIVDETSGANLPPTRLDAGSGWTKVAVAELQICGIRDGNAYCWGYTGAGENGAGIWREGRTRAEASMLGPADEIDVTMRQADSTDRTVCMRTGTTLKCWGDNSYGQLGVGLPSLFETPVEVPPPSGRTWAHLTAGDHHVCGTLDDNQVLCWGRNDVGAVDPQRPRGDQLPCTQTECDVLQPLATPIANLNEIVAGADFTCARQAATMRCWGDNRYNRLGVSSVAANGPTSFTSPSGTFMKLVPGSSGAMCAGVENDKLVCWGYAGNALSMLPKLETAPQISGITSIGFGDQFACLVSAEGTRFCAGRNNVGQIGDNNPSANLIAPWGMYTTPKLRAISARGEHSCAATTAGEVVCWGRNDAEQCGQDLNTPVVPAPTPVVHGSGPLSGCTAVAVANAHSCAICAGQVWCWGENYYGELGRGTRTYTHATASPIAAMSGLTFTELGTTEGGGCALTTTGQILCWGDSWRGEVGVGGSAKNVPTPVAGAL